MDELSHRYLTLEGPSCLVVRQGPTSNPTTAPSLEVHAELCFHLSLVRVQQEAELAGSRAKSILSDQHGAYMYVR